MYTIAIIGDILSVVPFVNIVSGFGTVVALSMFSSKEEDVFSSENMGGTLFTTALEMIPGISALPLWTVRVYLTKQKARKRRGG